MVKNFLIGGNKMCIEIQGTQRIPSRMNPKSPKPRHIVKSQNCQNSNERRVS
jgi:hypothetical protein